MAKAGATAGERNWTPFKLTCDRVRRYLADHPGATIKEVLKDVEHHYSSDASARQHLVNRIEEGVVKGVQLKRDGRTPRLYLDEPG